MDCCIDGNELKVETAILHLYKNKLFTDVTVKCNTGNIKFNVHKLVLALFSPLLSHRLYEKSECEIHIEDIALSAVENMISFCYGEPLIFKNIYDIKETKVIAEKYKIVELLNICMKEIETVDVDTSNVLTVLEMSVEFGNKNKEIECLEIISRNRETVFTSELFMKMKFESICQILEKLREMGFLTEAQYLRSALVWMGCDNTTSKEKLMKRVDISKLSRDEFVDIIISFPNFFTGTEISEVFRKIKSLPQKTTELLVAKSEISTESESSAKVDLAEDSLNEQKTENSNKKRSVTIYISDGIGGTKFATVIINDDVTRRGVRFNITGYLKDGIFESLLLNGIDSYTLNNVDITYDGLFFTLIYSNVGNKETLSSLNYIEVSKVASCFGLQKLRQECVKKVGCIVDYDPAFLDGLRQHFEELRGRLTSLLMRNTQYIILHPNFVNCSLELITTILSLQKLTLSSERELLIVTISWLEASIRLRWRHRFSLLYEIAFENISRSDLEYVSKRYPNFFSANEVNSIMCYKMASTCENRESLPKWYNFKRRNNNENILTSNVIL